MKALQLSPNAEYVWFYTRKNSLIMKVMEDNFKNSILILKKQSYYSAIPFLSYMNSHIGK